MTFAAQPEFVSYSANLEDVLLRRLFADTGPGFYVDVGAAHPEFESDTKALRDRGWRGINVEPNAEFMAALRRERPDDLNLEIALSDAPGELVFHEVPETGLSTLVAENARRAAAAGRRIVERRVAVATLAQVLADAGAPAAFELLKVDVEGAERAVLAGNDWSRFRPRVVVAEATVPESPLRRDDGVRELMEEVGWRHVWFDGLNDWYLAPGFEPPAEAFAAPPNVFDRYVTRRTAAAEAATVWLRDTVAERYKAIVSLEARAADHVRAAATRTAGLEVLADALVESLATGLGRLDVARLAARLCEPAWDNEGEAMADEVCLKAAMRLLEADNARLRAAVADSEGDLARHRVAVADLQSALVASRNEVARLQAALVDPDGPVALAVSAALSQAAAEHAARQAEHVASQQMLAAIFGSTSWRLSAPLRTAGRLLGRGRADLPGARQ